MIRILVSTHYYLPGFKAGGPIRTLSNMIHNLGDEYSFMVVASDRDYSDMHPYPGIIHYKWSPIGNARIFYLEPGPLGFFALSKLLICAPYDLIYLNSVFDPIFTLLPLLLRRLGLGSRRPVLLASRGELSAGALSLKPHRKKLFLWLAQCFGLYRNLIWHASSTFEANEIRDLMGKSALVQVAVDVPAIYLDSNSITHSGRREDEPLRIIFLSRLSPKKNLDYALRILKEVRSAVDFSIYGPVEDITYVDTCRFLADQLPGHIRVYWHSEIPPEHVVETLALHDLFLFPTRGENYGHVIAESLSAGTPVLISDTTPWRDLTPAGVGWDLPLNNPSAFVDCIQHMASLSPSQLILLRQRVKSYARDRLDLEAILAANRLIFSNAMSLMPHTFT